MSRTAAFVYGLMAGFLIGAMYVAKTDEKRAVVDHEAFLESMRNCSNICAGRTYTVNQIGPGQFNCQCWQTRTF